MDLTIPKDQEKVVTKLATMPAANRQLYIDSLSKATPSFAMHSLAEQVSPAVSESVADVEEVLSTLGTMYTFASSKGIRPTEFARGIAEAAKSIEPKIVPSNEDWASFSQFLERVLTLEPTLGVTAKAAEVILEHDRVYSQAKVMTDLRPIFGNDVAAPPISAVLIHNLRILFVKDNLYEEFFVALDERDLDDLIRTLQRAKAKEKTLKGFSERAGLKCLEIPQS